MNTMGDEGQKSLEATPSGGQLVHSSIRAGIAQKRSAVLSFWEIKTHLFLLIWVRVETSVTRLFSTSCLFLCLVLIRVKDEKVTHTFTLQTELTYPELRTSVCLFLTV